MRDLDQAIRERAYHLWVAGGCCDGSAEVHWLRAQREVLASSLESFAKVTFSKGLFSDQRTKRKPQAALARNR